MAGCSQVSEPVIVLANWNYASLNNLAHLENRGWKYVIRLKERPSAFGVNLPNFPEFDIYVNLTLGCSTKRKLETKKIPVPAGYYPLTSQRIFDFLPVESAGFYRLSGLYA